MSWPLMSNFSFHRHRVWAFCASLGCTWCFPPCSFWTCAILDWTKWWSLNPNGKCFPQSGQVHALCLTGRCSVGIIMACCVRRTRLHGIWILSVFLGITAGGASLLALAFSSSSSFGWALLRWFGIVHDPLQVKVTPQTGHGHFIPINALLDFAATSFGVSFFVRFLLCGGFFFRLVLALVGVLLHDFALVLPAVDACALATLAAPLWSTCSGFSRAA